MPKISIPENLMCPIAKYFLMEIPVLASDGNTYDRKNIEKWLAEHDESPVTGLPLQHKRLTRATMKQSRINSFLKKHKICTEQEFIVAIQAGDINRLRNLNFIENYLEASLIDKEGQTDWPYTVMQFASKQGYSKIVDFLYTQSIRGKELINEKENYTPLDLAIFGNHLEVIKLLLELGAKTELKDKNGFSSIYNAIATSNSAALKLLLQYKADPNASGESSNGWNPLHFAVKVGEIEKIELLLAYGANREGRAFNGTTSLHVAIMLGKLEAAKLLLKQEVNIEARDNLDQTPLHYAAIYRRSEIVALLLQAGANPNARDREGRNALHAAIVRSHCPIKLEIIKWLIYAGADPYATLNDGRTYQAIWDSTYNENFESIKYIDIYHKHYRSDQIHQLLIAARMILLTCNAGLFSLLPKEIISHILGYLISPSVCSAKQTQVIINYAKDKSTLGTNRASFFALVDNTDRDKPFPQATVDYAKSRKKQKLSSTDTEQEDTQLAYKCSIQ